MYNAKGGGDVENRKGKGAGKGVRCGGRREWAKWSGKINRCQVEKQMCNISRKMYYVLIVGREKSLKPGGKQIFCTLDWKKRYCWGEK